jgi:hypothetical protein
MPYTSPSISTISDDTLDVDFGVAAQAAGVQMGAIPDDPDMARGFRNYAADNKIYPRSEWPDRIEAMDQAKAWRQYRIVTSHNQNGEPSCVYNMLAAITETTWNTQFGDHNAIGLSPISGYRWNGSPRSGSNIFGSAAWSEGTGLIPLRNNINASLAERGVFHHTHPHNGYRAAFMDGWRETAACFRLHEWYRITSVEAWVSAAIDGGGLGGGRDGHAIFHCGLAIDGNRLYGVYLNSWGSWGSTLEVSGGRRLKSFGFDSESKIKAMVRHGAYCGRTIRKPSWMTDEIHSTQGDSR